MAETALAAWDLACVTGQLAGVSFELGAGSLTAIVGPADDDKDALAGLLMGSRVPAAGTLHLAGRPITRLSPAARVRRGLVYASPQTARVAAADPERAVPDALAAAAGWRHGGWWRRHPAPAIAEASRALLRFVGLAASPSMAAPASLARLALARALALGPRVLLVDRLTRGLDSADRTALAALLVRVAAGGIAVLWIEDDVDLAGEAAEATAVLAAGRLLADGRADRDAAAAAFLGAAP